MRRETTCVELVIHPPDRGAPVYLCLFTLLLCILSGGNMSTPWKVGAVGHRMVPWFVVLPDTSSVADLTRCVCYSSTAVDIPVVTVDTNFFCMELVFHERSNLSLVTHAYRSMSHHLCVCHCAVLCKICLKVSSSIWIALKGGSCWKSFPPGSLPPPFTSVCVPYRARGNQPPTLSGHILVLLPEFSPSISGFLWLRSAVHASVCPWYARGVSRSCIVHGSGRLQRDFKKCPVIKTPLYYCSFVTGSYTACIGQETVGTMAEANTSLNSSL